MRLPFAIRHAAGCGRVVAMLGCGLAGAAALYAHLPRRRLPEGARADRIVVEKRRRRLTLLHRGGVLKTYRVALGRDPVGAKRREGDGRTPEGAYHVDYRNPNSRFHRSLHVSYPDAEDRRRARAAGVDPGGDVMIHGLRNGRGFLGRFHRLRDWTDGCIAVTDAEVDELWRVVPDGTPVEIRP